MPSLTPSHAVAAPREGGSPATHNEAATASLWDSFRIQLRVIGALLMREILTRYGRKNIGFLWLFIEPMIFSLTVSFIWTQVRMHNFQGIPVFAFVLVSYTTLPLWRRAASRCCGAIDSNKSLLYHRHVSIVDFYFARIILEDAGATTALVGLVAFFSLIGEVPLPVDPLQVLVGWLLIAWFGFGLSLLVGSFVHRLPLLQKALPPLMLTLFLTSAVFFPVYLAPDSARDMLLWFPLTSGIEYLREGYFGPVIPYYHDIFYMAACNMALTVAGLLSLRLLANRVSAD